MSYSSLPLSYCTNVHPGQSVAEVTDGLTRYTVPAQKHVGQPLAAGLWLAAPVIQELRRDEATILRLQQALEAGGLICYTLNAFPYGDFHSERVKEQVYLPDWSRPERLDYTRQCAQVLARLLPSGIEGSLSTLPLGFKELDHQADFRKACVTQLLDLARDLDQLHDETGKVIRLAIEPEPRCEVETTAEAISFFHDLFCAAEERQLLHEAKRHLGICYDVCHQAVEFEDIPASIRQLSDAEIRINKMHLTCALHLDEPARHPDATRELAQYVEPRYLHQVFAQSADGSIAQQTDLTTELCENPPEPFRSASAWRVHFHVPVHRESLGSLGTTRNELKAALQAVGELNYAPHLEVETYTWGVLPEEKTLPLEQGLAHELSATQQLISEYLFHA